MDTQENTSGVEAKSPEGGPLKRKNKSLLALCKKFLQLYPLDMPPGSSLDIPLERLSETLKLSRRRLYDIINIMESLQMAVKVTKNLYRWYGVRNVQALLYQLKDMSDREINIDFADLCTSITSTVSSDNGAVPRLGSLQPPCTPQGEASAQSLLLRSLDLEQFLHPAAPQAARASTKKRHCSLVDMKESPEPKGPHSWKMKSLGGTCLKFLALFFKHESVSLDWAGRVLLCGAEDEKPLSQSSQSSQEGEGGAKEQERQLRNKIRRIYDVANVLCALGLVSKVSPRHSSSRKLLYAYSGPAICNLNPVSLDVEGASQDPPKPSRRAKKPEVQPTPEPYELRPSVENLCKRRLDLGANKDSRLCKRLLQDEVLLDMSASPFSMLLAVAERELGAASATSDSPQSQASAVDLGSSQPQKKPCVEIMPKPSSVQHLEQSENTKLESDDKNISSSNQENDFKTKSINEITTTESKKVLSQSLLSNRSALRSLLENNRNTPAKCEFPVIKKFVSNEDKIESLPASDANSQVQTVLIRNFGVPSLLVRRPALSIPWQLNHEAVNTPHFVTRLNVGLSAPPSPPPQH